VSADIVERRPSVALVVFDRDDVVCVRQTRRGSGTLTTELPQETLEPGETPLDGATRGLAEECGLAAEGWREIGSFFAAPAYSTEFVHVLTGRVAGTAVGVPDADEDITIVRVPTSDVWAAVDDATSLAALALWERDRLR
jgi:ADP-ribose pyrophosphatase